ncbi:MAG: flagellar motor protein PomA [Legionellales bacterium]|nr:flagellar motor protein PomA [Legionellales bacterium]
MPVAIGLFAAYGFIYYQIADTGVPLYGGFFEEVIFLFVAGGSLMCTLMRNSFMDFLRMLGSFGKFVYYSQPDQLKLVQEVVELANVNRRDGPIAMQNIEVANKDLRRAVDMVVDGTDSAIIETTLNTDIAITREREQVTVDMLKFWADVAPSFGMIGTMIGLVGMLKNMDDLKGIGDSFAIALLTTMWGAIIAYTVAKPWAEKLEGYSKTDVQAKQLIVEGALMIKANTNPRLIADRLSSRLAPKARAEMAENNQQEATNA